MIVSTEATLAMRCPTCGKLEFHKISRFALTGWRKLQVNCSCGALKLVISAIRKKQYRLQIPCVLCGSQHLRTFTGNAFWPHGVIGFFCFDTGLELGYLGPVEEVQRLAGHREAVSGIPVDEFMSKDYFHNSEVMYAVLNHVHSLAERRMIYCQCGNQDIEVDVFPDRLELHCSNCDSINIVYAETEEDLEVVRRVQEIELTESGFQCLDSLASTRKLPQTPPQSQS